jgi:hypothetical protein
MPADDHGSASTYSNWHCRCEACRAAHAAKSAHRRIARRALLSQGAPVSHGKASTYTNWGCRCRDCCSAHTEVKHQWKLRRASRAVA